ncbi:hypothetical protein UlMin_023965, partial [Ulmus minor]
VYTITCIYTAKQISFKKVMSDVPKVGKRLMVRHRLKKGYGIEGGIPVVFSLEKPKAKLFPFKGPNGEENPSDYQ